MHMTAMQAEAAYITLIMHHTVVMLLTQPESAQQLGTDMSSHRKYCTSNQARETGLRDDGRHTSLQYFLSFEAGGNVPCLK